MNWEEFDVCITVMVCRCRRLQRRTGLTRNTVRTWLKAAEGTEPKYRRRAAEGTKIAPFAEQLTKALEIDARRPKRDRRTALKLFGELQAAGFDGRLQPGHRVRPALARERRPGAGQSLCAAASSSWAKPSSSTGAKNAW